MTTKQIKLNFAFLSKDELLHILEDADHALIVSNLLGNVRHQRKTEMSCWECEAIIRKLELESQL